MSASRSSRERVESLSADKRMLLERLLLSRAGRSSTIPPRDRSRPAPLAPPQHRLWFLDQLAPGAPTYNAVVAVRARGRLDLDALRAALEIVVDRHEILRTVIEDGPDGPAQRLLDEWEPVLVVTDAAGTDATGRWDDAVAIVREFSRRPFDLARDLTLRVVAVRLGPEDHLIGFAEHHISFDGFSDEVLFAELGEGYAALVDGRPWQPAPLAVQYADVAQWWHDHPADTALEDYWTTTLAGAPPQTQLPADMPRPEVQQYAGEHVPVRVEGVTEALTALQIAESATAFMVLSAAFAASLYRWTGGGDIVLGTPFANRARVEFEPMIGFFSNTVPLRFRISGGDSFRELIRRSRTVCIGAFAHQEVPFERIVELSGTTRDPRYNPLFQANVRIQQGPRPLPRLPGVETSAVDIDLGFSRFDIALDLTVVEDALEGYLEYNQAVFERASVDRFLTWLQEFLLDALTRPDEPLQSLRFGPAAGGIRGRRRTSATRP